LATKEAVTAAHNKCLNALIDSIIKHKKKRSSITFIKEAPKTARWECRETPPAAKDPLKIPDNLKRLLVGSALPHLRHLVGIAFVAKVTNVRRNHQAEVQLLSTCSIRPL
jgi:hypothetical protein